MQDIPIAAINEHSFNHKHPKYYKSQVFRIIGAAMRVHSELRWGLLEPIYNEALCIELRNSGIECESEQEITCYYKDQPLSKKDRMDIVVGDDICIELKSVSELLPEHRAQLMNYLRLTKRPIGILINFGKKRLQGERYYYNPSDNNCYLLDKDMDILEYTDEE